MRYVARSSRPAAGEQGFSLLELLVALAVMVLVLVGVAMVFDFNSKLARAQTHVSEMQQSVRVGQQSIVRMVRMTGRGGLPVGTLPAGRAFEVCNNAQLDPQCGRELIAEDDADSYKVVPGTDVLTIRGIFSAPIWQINHADATSFTLVTSGSLITGTLRIPPVSHTSVPQPTAALQAAISAEIPEALFLISPAGDQILAVVEVDPAASTVDPDGTVHVGFRYTEGEHTDAYQALSDSVGEFPDPLTSVAFAGVLEEYRYYIRLENAVRGDETTEVRPTLAMMRVYPGTEAPYGGSVAGANVDIADNILDLQVALGMDLDGDGLALDAASEDDEWLFNHPDDDEADPRWNLPGRRLSYLRITTLARTDRPERNYVAAPIEAIEDHRYDEPAGPANDSERRERMHRRRVIQSVVDLRNL